MSAAKVTGLWIYPVKSCRGISLREMQMGDTGPMHDRQWMIVDSLNHFISLRTHPKLAEIKTSLQGPFLHLYLGTNKVLINRTEECDLIEPVTVWGDNFNAGIEAKDVNETLSDFLSESVKLVRYQRQSFRDLKGGATEVVKQTMFADGRPVLLVNENSLSDLNSKLRDQGSEPAVLERFRSNIIVDGLDPFAEDKINEVQIGEVILSRPKLCARCPIVTQDIETGNVVSKETLKTLAKFRQFGSGSGVMFGLNLTPSKLGLIRINDAVKILS